MKIRAKTIRYTALGLCFGLMVSCTAPATNRQPETEAGNYQLVWADEFDYTGLPDTSKWSFDTEGNAWGWGNNEAQFYTSSDPDNASVKDGQLFITALKEEMNGHSYSSARLRTAKKGDWLYGRFEVRAKLPSGRGMWPAIWLLPTDWEYGGWPQSGEIDLMENVGYAPDTILSTVHTEAFNHVRGIQKGDSIVISTCYTDFHVYRLDWEADSMAMFVDGQHVFTFRKEGSSFAAWPFDKRFHLLLNVAVGGNWGGKFGIDDSIFPRTMVVDYVRVYQRK